MSKLWKVTKLERTADRWYKFHVEGFNIETGARFSWSVPDVDDERYDLDDVDVVSLAQETA